MRTHAVSVISSLLLLLIPLSAAPAQDAASVAWGLAGNGSVTTTSGWVFGISEQASGFTIGYDATYTGAFINYENIQKLKPSDNGGAWPAEAGPADGRYIQFAIFPRPIVSLTVDSVSILLAAKGTQNLMAQISVSNDASFATDSVLGSDLVLSSNDFLRYVFPSGLSVTTTETVFVRVYPWNATGDGGSTSKYLYIRDASIYGTTTGTIIADPATLSTTAITRISTETATGGGTITNDGGAAIVTRGVCWNTSGSPTIADSIVSSGAGTGAFETALHSLSPGVQYFVRAFATNSAGTAYGNENSFTTLDSLMVPSLTTVAVHDIRPTHVATGGSVSGWGGTDVLARGVCWTNSGTPTINDAHTVDGSGEGSFVSAIIGLAPSTSYIVRAYATNSTGTGYGQPVAFSTPAQAPDIWLTVTKDGSGDYTTVQDAFNAVPSGYNGDITVFVKKGVYYEKDTLVSGKEYVTLLGEDRDSTIITYDDYSGRVVDGVTLGTSTSFTMAIDSDNFSAKNITIQNTYHTPSSQAVALRSNGDKQMFVNCNILGYQDTYYAWGGSGTGRVYFLNCLIEGSVDFIFGRDIVVFDSCRININREGGMLTAANTEPSALFGLTFRDCIVTHDSVGFDGRVLTYFHLGRPWQNSPRTVFIRCELPSILNSAGWQAWNVDPALYAEYANTGPGAQPDQRVNWSVQLTDEEAATYTLENIFAKTSFPGFTSGWSPNPSLITAVESADADFSSPRSFGLLPNYPNPFNPETTVSFSLDQRAAVNIRVVDLLGRIVSTLYDGQTTAGVHKVTWDGASVSSGMYLCILEARRPNGETFRSAQKMLLVR